MPRLLEVRRRCAAGEGETPRQGARLGAPLFAAFTDEGLTGEECQEQVRKEGANRYDVLKKGRRQSINLGMRQDLLGAVLLQRQSSCCLDLPDAAHIDPCSQQIPFLYA